MAPPRKSGTSGPDEAGADPERENHTVPRARPLPPDPETERPTNARVRAPVGRPRARPARPSPRAPRGAAEEEYRTGSDYDPGDDLAASQEVAGEGLARSAALEGDGLEALDPEVGSRTRALPLDEVDDEPGAGGAEAPDEDDADDADDADATRAGPPLTLEIYAGPDAGRRRRFKGVRMVVGRTPGVDLKLSDQSVSRRHVELVRGEAGVVLRDLGSGNGTRVNGNQVAEKLLEHGDEIALGKTRIRFLDEVAAFRKAKEEAEKQAAEEKARAEAEEKARAELAAQATASSPAGGEGAPSDTSADAPTHPTRGISAQGGPRARVERAGARGRLQGAWERMNPRLRLAVVGLGAVVVIIVVAGVVLRNPPPPPVDPNRAVAEQKLQDARAAVKAGDFEGAVRLADEAEKLIPGIDRTHLATQARDELAFAHGLDEARGHLGAHRFQEARGVLEKLGRGTVRGEEARTRLQAEVDGAEVTFKRAQIDEALAAGDADQARALLGELPADQQDESAQKIAEFERQLGEQRKQDDALARHQAALAAAARKSQREEEIAGAFTTVERKFAGGEWERATSECNRVLDAYASDAEIKARARLLQTQIPAFGRAYDEGLQKYRQGALAQAARPLRQALGLYGQLKLTANRFGPELESKLGDASIAAGREALLRDDLVTAYQSYRDAARFDPSDVKARAGLSEVEGKAQELFQLAYVLKDRDPKEALKKFKIVELVTEAGSSVHEKAKNHIAEMQP
jgi:pSer/pThr/pTyr-binding forkhead associated (FHA) protein